MLQVPYIGEGASESECFCFGYAGSVDAQFKLTKRAFVPGDYLTFETEIRNSSGTSIENACAKLMAVSSTRGARLEFDQGGDSLRGTIPTGTGATRFGTK